MSDKPKIALYWCASCGGCEESIVDLAEDILTVTNAVDIIFWPVGMDFKKEDVEKMEDGSITATLLNGAIRTSEQEEMARMLRKKSKLMIAYGSCAHTGGIPSLSNLFHKEHILKYVYEDAPTNEDIKGIFPTYDEKGDGSGFTLPVFRNAVRALDQIVDVDYYLPGCPPVPKLLKEAVFAILENKLPPKGTVLAPDLAQCETCDRKATKPEKNTYSEYKRVHKTEIDPEKCFLAQGIVCMGPATRSGCDNACQHGNMPCTGCFGPMSNVKDQGVKMLSSITSAIEPRDEDEIDKVLDGIPDPAGTFYRYGMAHSFLRVKK